MASQASTEDVLDFSQPWELSDVVLVVEEERFHVHRSILAMWSPVFSKMFTAQFKEKTAKEIPLPEKKAREIKELLLVIYPTSSKQVDKDNYVFLLDLAKEYMMTKLTQKCEAYLMNDLGKSENMFWWSEPRCLDLLGVAQDYQLEKLQAVCVNKAKSMGFREFKNHKMYKKINFSNYRKIVEGKIEKMEIELSNKDKELNRCNSASERGKSGVKSRASDSLKEFENVISILVFLVCKSDSYFGSSDATVTAKLQRLQRSGGEFKNLYRPLSNLHTKLQSLCQ